MYLVVLAIATANEMGLIHRTEELIRRQSRALVPVLPHELLDT